MASHSKYIRMHYYAINFYSYSGRIVQEQRDLLKISQSPISCCRVVGCIPAYLCFNSLHSLEEVT